MQRRVTGTIEAEIAGAPGGEERASQIAGDTDIIALMECHVGASIALVEHVVARVGDSARVACNAVTPYRSILGSERDDALLTGFILAATQIDGNVLNPAGNRLVGELNARIAQPRLLSALHVTIRNPTLTSAAQLAESGEDRLLQNLQATADAGVRELALYNYGLLPDCDVRAFMSAVGQLDLG